MANDLELQDLRQRLEFLEAKLASSDDPGSDIVPGRVLTPTRHDYHLSLILLLNDPSANAFLDEVIDADSLPEARERLTQIKTRKTRYKRKVMILQAAETWKNYT